MGHRTNQNFDDNPVWTPEGQQRVLYVPHTCPKSKAQGLEGHSAPPRSMDSTAALLKGSEGLWHERPPLACQRPGWSPHARQRSHPVGAQTARRSEDLRLGHTAGTHYWRALGPSTAINLGCLCLGGEGVGELSFNHGSL